MKRIFLLIAGLLSVSGVFATVGFTVNIASGTKVTNTGALQVNLGTSNFVNNGTYSDAAGTTTLSGAVTFSGSGTTGLYNLGVNTASGTSLFSSVVTVNNTGTITAGNVNANGDLTLAVGASLVNNGSLTNNVLGLVTNATVTTGGCPSYASTLSLNISGTKMQYQWQSSPDNSTWTNVSGANSATYAATVTTTIYYRCNLTTSNTAYAQSTPGKLLTFTGTYPTITLGTSPTVVSGTTSANLPYSGTSGGPSGYNIYYDGAAQTAGFSNTLGSLTGGNIPLIVPAAAPAAVYNGTVTVTNGCVSTPTAFTITIQPAYQFSGGSPQTLTLCQNAAATSINSLLALNDVSTGLTETWSVSSGPTNGTLGGFNGTGLSNGSTVTPTGLTYTPNASYSGPDAFTIQVTNGTYTTTTTVNVTINPLPIVDAGGAVSAICQGQTTAALGGSVGGGATGGTWSDGSAGGTFTNNDGTAPGTTTYTASASSITPVTLTLTTGGGFCSTTFATKSLTVNPNPTVNVGGAVTAICQGQTTAALGGSVGGGATGGTWSDGIAGGSFTNNDGTSPGTTTYTASASSTTPVTLTLTTGGGFCSTTFATKSLTVNPNPTVNVGGAVTAICQGQTTAALGGSVGGGATGGTWSDGSAGGSFTNNDGTSPGTTTYTASASSTTPVTLTLTTGGGFCSTTFATKSLTVNPNPTVNVGGAVTAICQGQTTAALGGSVGGGATGGTWSDGAAGGSFTNNDGTSPGTTTYTASASSTTPVTLTLTTGGGLCSTTFATKSLTVNPNPTVNVGGAVTAICQGQTTAALGGSVGGGATGGTWSDGAAGGSFTNNDGTSPGTTTYTASASSTTPVTLTLTTGGGFCSTTFATKSLTVNPNPTVNVVPVAAICLNGTTAALGGSVGGGATGGTWSDNGAGGTFTNNSGSTPSLTTYTTPATSPASVTLTLTTSGGLCGSTSADVLLTVNPLPNIDAIGSNTPVCSGTTLSLTSSASGGTGTLTYSWATPNLSSVGGQNPNILSVPVSDAGTYTLTVTDVNNCVATGTNTTNVVINPAPTLITGIPYVLNGSSVTLSDGTPGGAWGQISSSVAIVSAGGIVNGVSPGSALISYTIPGCPPATETIIVVPTGVVCVGTSIQLSDATSGGTWASSLYGVATVSNVGVVTGLTPGTTVIRYGLHTGAVTTWTITVNPLSATTGATSVCQGLTTTMTNATTGGGVWASNDNIIATVGNTGVTLGSSAGTATIYYITTPGCVTTKQILVNPTAPITGPASVCIGQSIHLSDAVAGGVWASSNGGVATISTSGIVTAMTTGTTTVRYTLPTGCQESMNMTVNPLSQTTGATAVCQGLTITLANTTSGGGTWSSGTGSVATISNTGVVTGVGAGKAVISFTTTGGCIATNTVTVNAATPIIGGPASVCIGQTVSLSDITSGGAWSSSNNGGATVNATTGVVTGVTASTDIIRYTLTGGCQVSATVTVNPLSQTTGATTVCPGLTITLANTTTGGGTWSSGTGSVATVSNTGVVTGVSGGKTVISFITSAGCVATNTVTVTTTAPITGPSSVCVGMSIGLSDAITGGTWTSSNNADASVVTNTGVVTGLVASTQTIKYGLPGGCQSVATVTVNPLSATTGPSAVVQGQTITLTNTTSGGGTWSTSTSSIATVSNTGVVSGGGSTGVAIISFTTTGGCITTSNINVTAGALPITGTPMVCVGQSIQLSDASAGGTWASNIYGVATVTSTGLVTGLLAGNTVVRYTLPTGSFTTLTVTVNPLSSTTGPTAVCEGQTMTLTNTTPGGGVWSSSDNSLATITAGGIVGGGAPGVIVVSFTTLPGCITTNTVTVNPTAPITGAATVCAGVALPLSDAVTGGVWGSTEYGVATVNNAGVVTGLTGGNTTILYTLHTGCQESATLTINDCGRTMEGTTAVQTVGTTADVQLFPNPNKGVFTIKGTLATQEDAEVTIEITDMLGQMVYKKTTVAQSGNINEQIRLDNTIANSMYIVSVRSGAENKVFHIVIEE